MTKNATPMPPPPPVKSFDNSIHGYWGELGGEGAFSIRYLQSAVAVGSLDKFSLVANIPGSESWGVRELFQRDIDQKRVTSRIVPYLKNPRISKFFNPLTIALLPFGRDHRVLAKVPEDPPERVTDQGIVYEVRTAKGYYQLRHCLEAPQYSEVRWNSSVVRMVAIDGQHRLSALLRMKSEMERNPGDEDLGAVAFSTWAIPVVILIPSTPSTKEEPGLLPTVRKIFVSINTTAQVPTRSRRILLTDDDVLSIACQEVLEACHDAHSAVPLEFFDWRSHEEAETGGIESPLALMRVDELEDLHENYLLGPREGDPPERITDAQRNALGVGPDDEVLALQGEEFWDAVRHRYRETLRPLVLSIIKDFHPWTEYIRKLRSLEKSATDIRKHALSQLRYGAHHADPTLAAEVDREVASVSERCLAWRSDVPDLVRRDIGPRAIMFAAGRLKQVRDDELKKTGSWQEYAKWFVPALNAAYQNKWIEPGNPLLRHIVFDHQDAVVNYRLTDVPKGLGAVLVLAIGRAGKLKPNEWSESGLEVVLDTLVRGYKRELRPQIRDDNPDVERAELNEMVQNAAQQAAAKQLKKIRKALSLEER